MALSPDALFHRSWRVLAQIADEKLLDLSALDVEFKILRSLKPTPNRASVTLWNLKPEHRATLLKRNRPAGPTGAEVPIFIRVEAGYQGRNQVLLAADLREVASRRDGTDWKMLVTLDDGGASVRATRFPNGGIQFNKGTKLSAALTYMCELMWVGRGNVDNYLDTANIFGWNKVIPHTLTLKGGVWDAMQRVCDSLGITVSIQNGVLQFLAKGRPIGFNPNNPTAKPIDAILLTPDTGLLDSPEAAMDSSVPLGFAKEAKGKPSTPKPPTPKNTAILKAKAMLIPGLVPGRVVRLETDAYKGNYEISEVEYVGQSFGKDWMAVMVLRSYVTA